jgi:hypothetical protein
MQKAVTRLRHSKQLISVTMIAHATEKHVTSSVTSLNNRTAAGSGVATRSFTRGTVPLQWNTWYHATHIWLRYEAISLDRASWVQLVGWSRVELSWELGSWKPARQLQWDRWKPARTWSCVHGNWGVYSVRSRNQATGEHTVDWGDLVRAVVKCWVCELAIAV